MKAFTLALYLILSPSTGDGHDDCVCYEIGSDDWYDCRGFGAPETWPAECRYFIPGRPAWAQCLGWSEDETCVAR